MDAHPLQQPIHDRGDRRPAKARGAGAFLAFVALFLLAGADVAAWNLTAPFAHGWWLVAYLGLVGGIAQLMLGPGQFVVADRLQTTGVPARVVAAELALWNVGTVLVPVGVLANASEALVAGRALLAAALVLFAVGLRRMTPRAQRRAPWTCRCYAATVAFLAVSVLVGLHLGEAMPWS